MLTKRAFTLIELLIVVAIIAILAAIAVPNFLEAQVRSKVSRTKADMRSIATGLEAYRVDQNFYPIMGDIWGTDTNVHVGYPNTLTFHSRMSSVLTTPIAYMTSTLEDVFIPKLQPPPTVGRYNVASRVWARYTYFNYPEFLKDDPNSASFNAGLRMTGGWVFYSWGPDMHPNNTSVTFGQPEKLGIQRTWTRYDPTNGTVSLGNVIRTQRSSEGSIPYDDAITGPQNGPN